MPLKIGPNFEDMNRIREWVEEGVTSPEEIGRLLNIKAEGVRIFLEGPKEPEREPDPEPEEDFDDYEDIDDGEADG